MNPKKFVFVGGGALVVCTAILLLFEPRRTVPNQTPAATRSFAPSKENVSKRVREKIDHLRRVVEKNRDDSRALFELAQLLQDAHNLREASAYYARGLRVDGGNNAARIDYSLCLFEMGWPREALEQNLIVLKRDPTNAQACYNAGAIYANLGVPDSARIYWSRIISSHPDDELAKSARENMKKLPGGSPSS